MSTYEIYHSYYNDFLQHETTEVYVYCKKK